MRSLRRFLKEKSANIGVLTAILTVPLLLALGLATDYARGVSARSHMQELADATALALAASGEQDSTKLRDLADKFVGANESKARVDMVSISELKTTESSIDLFLKGQIRTHFMKLAGIHTVDVRASVLAERAVVGSVEVALVLDNTWSMSEVGPTGVTKIATLKTAAQSLVTELMNNKKASVRIGIVPYADYVNVGTKYRGSSWLSVPDDYVVPAVAATCTTSTTKSVCTAYAPTYPCTKTIDGVVEPATCGGGCTQSTTQTVPPYQVCSGGSSKKTYRWYGCVGSRMNSDSRLHDGRPADTYPGYVETSQRCLNPIVPLTDNLQTLTAGISGMVINIGSYKPYTYIPAGLIWGQNVLSQDEPLDQGKAYDLKNKLPRKVAVLMTDGENTLRFRNSDGRHVQPSSNAATAKGEIKKTNDDTKAICDYMKANKIEIYTVAFMVTDPDAKQLLENCATDASHYYDASDPAKLLAAFSGIAQSLAQVRLAR